MTDKFKGFLITLEKEVRNEDAGNIINMINETKR